MGFEIMSLLLTPKGSQLLWLCKLPKIQTALKNPAPLSRDEKSPLSPSIFLVQIGKTAEWKLSSNRLIALFLNRFLYWGNSHFSHLSEQGLSFKVIWHVQTWIINMNHMKWGQIKLTDLLLKNHMKFFKCSPKGQ